MSERATGSGLAATGALLATLAGVLAWAWMVSDAWALASGLVTSRDQLERAGRHLQQGALKKARYEILAGAAATDAAGRAFARPNPLLDLARAVPEAAEPLGELDHLVGAAGHLADAARGTLEVTQGSLRGPERIVAKAPGGGSEVRLERVVELAEVVARVRADLGSARRHLTQVDLDALPRRFRSAVRSGISRAADTDEVLADAQNGLELLPDILGARDARNYLIGMQNNAELRGSGGAMLRFSILRFRDGRPTLLPNKSVYQLDINRKTLDVPLPRDAWYVRGIEDAQRFGNANWSPDWPLSAQVTLHYAYASNRRLPKENRLPRLDGVIAVDPMVMQNLMPGVGSFRIETGKKISRRDVLNYLLYEAYARFPRFGARRAVLKHVVDDFYDNLLAPAHPTLLLEGFGRSLARKNMQVWLARRHEQRFMRHMDWDGAIDDTGGDYLYVVQQNVGGNKLNYWERQSHTMDVTISGTDARVTSTVSVANPVSLPAPRYMLGNTGPLHRPMINVYVPRSARLLRAGVTGTRNDLAAEGLSAWANGRPPEYLERGKKVWPATLDIPAREEGSVTYEYVVPRALTQEGERTVYHLKVQHQQLLNPADLKVTVHLPRRARAVRANGWKRQGNKLVLARPLKEDIEVEASWRE